MSVRVKVCLNKFFKDYRKEAVVFVNPNWNHVVDLEKHIQELFNIQFSIYLTVEDDSLLPSAESIRVIHSGDIIIVNKSNDASNNGLEVSSIESGNEVNHRIGIIEIENHSSDEINPSKRGKRIRKRKRKQTSGNDVEVHEDQTNLTRQKSNLTVQPNKLLKESKKLLGELSLTDDVSVSSKKTNSHIRFGNEVVTKIDETMPNKSVPANHSEALQARVIRPVVVMTDAGYSVPLDDEVLKTSFDSASKPECKEGIASLKKFANDSNFTKVAASIDFSKIIKNIDQSKEFVTLKEEPKTYDVVGFKMLKIGKNYEPQLSEWIIAMVKDVEDEAHITLRILAGIDETSCPDGKLSMDIGEEETEQSDLITVVRSDMLNVKVFLNE